jgi:hypothetical protein
MDLRRELRSINTEVPKPQPVRNTGSVRDLPQGEVQQLIHKVCSRYPGGMGFLNLRSCIGALTACYGIPFEVLEVNAGYFDQFISPGSAAEIKTVRKVIQDLRKSFSGQVGSKMNCI